MHYSSSSYCYRTSRCALRSWGVTPIALLGLTAWSVYDADASCYGAELIR